MTNDPSADTGNLTIALVALVIGAVLEMRRISPHWHRIMAVLAAAIGVTLFGLVFSVLRGNSVAGFATDSPKWFIFAFLTASAMYFWSELSPKLGEGVTLLHSGALVYFLAEHGKHEPGAFIFLFFCTVPTLFSVLHAVSNIELTRTSRVLLCLWSTVVMLVFSGVYIFTIWGFPTNARLAVAVSGTKEIIVFSEALVLGATGPYIVRHVLSLFMLLPDKHGRASDPDGDIDAFIEGYSAEQVSRAEVGVVAVVAGVLWVANYRYELVEPSTAIWACFVAMPAVFWGLNKLGANSVRSTAPRS